MTPTERLAALMGSIPAIPGITPTDFTTFDLDGGEDWVSTIAMDDYDRSDNTLFYNPAWVAEASDQHIVYALAFHTVVRSTGMSKNPEGVDEARWNIALNYFVNDILERNGVVSGMPERLIEPEYRDKTVEDIYAIVLERYPLETA